MIYILWVLLGVLTYYLIKRTMIAVGELQLKLYKKSGRTKPSLKSVKKKVRENREFDLELFLMAVLIPPLLLAIFLSGCFSRDNQEMEEAIKNGQRASLKLTYKLENQAYSMRSLQ